MEGSHILLLEHGVLFRGMVERGLTGKRKAYDGDQKALQDVVISER